MNTTSKILLLLLICMLYQCKSRRHSTNSTLKETNDKTSTIQAIHCISAQYSHWKAGIESGGSGIDIYVKCEVLNPKISGFDSLVIQSISFPVQVSRKTIRSGDEIISFKTGDTISLKSGKKENKSSPENLRALKGNLSGKLYYRINDAPVFLEVNSIVEIPSVNRP